MCGILGYCSERNIDQRKLLSTLGHRGPDSEGFIQFQLNQKQIGIGHTRLSILDLSENGQQPMQNSSGDVIIAFNGEIYNFQELKLTFLKEFFFKSGTDTEVILNLYLKYGIDFIEKLNGDFAFAIIDKRINKLFLIRDRVGVKPLYYSLNKSEFVFASEIKTLLSYGVPRKLNISEIQHYFIFKYSPKEKTLFENIHRLKPGNYLEYDLNSHKILIKTYWELKKNNSFQNLSYKDAQVELKRLLENSVQARLISDVPIASFLSGGLDSSVIAFYLKNNPEIHHYCAIKNKFDLKKEGTTSDGYYAQKLSENWKLKLSQVPISSDEANLDLIKKTLYFGDDLIADGSQIPSYLITKEAAKTSKVILSGMGADELFLGYAGHQISLISSYFENFPKFITQPLSRKMSKINQGRGKFLAYRRYLHKLGKYAAYDKMKYGFFNIVGDYHNSLAIFKHNEEESLPVFKSYFYADEPIFDSIFKFEYENFLQKNLNYMDRMTMANSVEARVPFLDHKIIEFAYSIPREYKLSVFGKTKKIIKDAYQNDLPEFVIKRRKAGFGMPLRSIFSTKESVFNLLNLEFFANFDGFSIEAILAIIDNHIQGKEDNSSIIYALISFQIWYQIYIEDF